MHSIFLALISCSFSGNFLSSASASEHVTIKFDNLLCVEESDVFGEDDVYLVAIGVNLRTGRTRAMSYGFPNIGNGDHQRIPSNTGIVFSDWVNHPSDLLVLVALIEHEGEFNKGYILQGGENGMGKSMALQAQKEIDQLAKQYSTSIRAGTLPRHVAQQAIREKMRYSVNRSKGNNQTLGVYSHGMQKVGFWQNWVSGDGYKYLVGFKRVPGKPGVNSQGKTVTVTDPLLAVKTHRIRFRIRDSVNKQPLPARVQIASNGKHIVDRRALVNGQFEESLMPGTYRVRFTMYEPHVSHHTLVQNITIGSNALNREILLQPIHIGNHRPSQPSQSIDLTGYWRASLVGQSIAYGITQSGNSIQWNAPQLKETASGSINGKKIIATLKGPFGTQKVSGIVSTNSSGKAVEISWSNGVIFVRDL